MFTKPRIFIITALMAFSLLLGACSTDQGPVTIRIAVLPILDALPMYVADAQGYFEEEGLTVEFIPVSSAPERDQLIQSGQADGMINELVSTLFYNQDETVVVSVRFARTAGPGNPVFRILAAPNSGISSVQDLAGVPIGVSEATIIEYMTDRVLEAEGLSPDQIETVAVPRIPERLALLASGELAAANLPEPLSSLAVSQGAIPIIDDANYPEYGHSVLTFRSAFIDENPKAIKGFLNALEKATVDLNSDKAQWSTLIQDRQLIPPPLVGTFQVPDFPLASVPTEAQWQDTADWALAKGYADTVPGYKDSIDGSYLP